MSRRSLALTLGAAVALASAAVWAQSVGQNISVESMRGEKRVALVIGNGSYVPPATLRNPLNDARDMAEELRQLGFDVSLQTDADLKAMQRAVREFGARLRPDGVALFYYAGHGLQVRGINYLIPLGARIGAEAEVEDEALDVNRVLKVMDESRSRVSIVVLDACRDNPFSRGFRSATRGLAMMPAPSGSFIAYATGPGAVAADGPGRNGLFTGELLKAMRTPRLDVVDVFRHVIASVRQRTNGRQVPWTLSSLDGYFYFSLPKDFAADQEAERGESVEEGRRLQEELARVDAERRRAEEAVRAKEQALEEEQRRRAEEERLAAKLPSWRTIGRITEVNQRYGYVVFERVAGVEVSVATTAFVRISESQLMKVTISRRAGNLFSAIPDGSLASVASGQEVVQPGR